MAELLRKDQKVENTWDIESIFPTEEDFWKQFKEVEEFLPEIKNYKGKVTNGAKELLEVFKVSEKWGIKLEELYIYAFFRNDQDSTDSKNKEIYARCVVENTEIKLINIEYNSDILDIDQIFLNIPTPFKKCDILVSKSRTMFNYGDYSDIFVLDYLCTWKEGIEDTLTKGNYDSSDMIGYGYYLYGEDSTEFVLDHK